MISAMEDECSPGIVPKYECGSFPKGKVLVVLFPDQMNNSDNFAFDALRAKTEKSFENIGYEPMQWNGYELRRVGRSRFLDDIGKVAKELPPSESFAMVVICSHTGGKLVMTSGDSFEMEDVYLQFDANSCQNLKSKPKLFVFDIHPYEVQQQDVHLSAKNPLDVSNIPQLLERVPLEADMLVVYSFEGSRQTPIPAAIVQPSPSFINVLTEVLENDFKMTNGHKDILELMMDVSNRILQLNGPDSPIPIVLSTLTSQYYLKKNV